MVVSVCPPPHPDAGHPAGCHLGLLERSRFPGHDRLSPLEQAPTVGSSHLVLERRQSAGADLITIVQEVGVQDQHFEAETRHVDGHAHALLQRKA
eukprot:9128991-Heterocapsa_arctica.AAC.1